MQRPASGLLGEEVPTICTGRCGLCSVPATLSGSYRNASLQAMRVVTALIALLTVVVSAPQMALIFVIAVRTKHPVSLTLGHV